MTNEPDTEYTIEVDHGWGHRQGWSEIHSTPDRAEAEREFAAHVEAEPGVAHRLLAAGHVVDED